MIRRVSDERVKKRIEKHKKRIRGKRFCPHCGEPLETEFSKVKSKEDLEKLFAEKCKEREIEIKDKK